MFPDAKSVFFSSFPVRLNVLFYLDPISADECFTVAVRACVWEKFTVIYSGLCLCVNTSLIELRLEI